MDNRLEKNVVYASDERFAEILAVSMESLMENNNDLNIYILNNGLSKNSIDNLENQAKNYSANLFFIPLKNIKDYAGRELACQKKITVTTFFRLFLTDILPKEIDKVLYIDCDTLICKNLDDLFSYTLINSCGNIAEPTARLMKKKIGLKKEDIYYNAGVMLIDLKKWREAKVSQLFIDYIEEMQGDISFEDQGVINHVLKSQIDTLPVKYNVETQYFDLGYNGFSKIKKDKIVYSKEDVEKAISDPAIVHFTNSFASERPWEEGSQHKYCNKWQNLKQKTAWKDGKQWPSNKSFSRKTSRFIYGLLPGVLKYRFIYFANGIIRPLIEK